MATDKRRKINPSWRFNPELVELVKAHAADREMGQTEFVERIIKAHLATLPPPSTPTE